VTAPAPRPQHDPGGLDQERNAAAGGSLRAGGVAVARAALSTPPVPDPARTTHNTIYHPSCTVNMGTDDDPMAPVTPTLQAARGGRTTGGRRLVMPDLITVNPCITTMMIGERCADFIRRGA